MNASDGNLSSDVEGEIESVDGVLVIKRIRVSYRLAADPEVDRAAIERVHEMHATHCPVYRSLHPQIEITTTLEIV